MNKKLYQVSVEFEMYISAENPKEAEKIARRNCADELLNLKNNQVFFVSQEIKNINQVPGEDRTSLPWSNDVSEVTIKDILSQHE